MASLTIVVSACLCSLGFGGRVGWPKRTLGTTIVNSILWREDGWWVLFPSVRWRRVRGFGVNNVPLRLALLLLTPLSCDTPTSFGHFSLFLAPGLNQPQLPPWCRIRRLFNTHRASTHLSIWHHYQGIITILPMRMKNIARWKFPSMAPWETISIAPSSSTQ